MKNNASANERLTAFLEEEKEKFFEEFGSTVDARNIPYWSGKKNEMKNNIICKIFGHKIIGLNVKRRFAKCGRCYKGLKVSYDMSYGETVVDEDYGNQKTFIWCECGNELCSTNSWLEYESKEIVEKIDVEVYKCSKCGEISKWDFGAPVPIRISGYCECKNAEMGYTDKWGINRCADCNLLEK